MDNFEIAEALAALAVEIDECWVDVPNGFDHATKLHMMAMDIAGDRVDEIYGEPDE